MDSFSNEQRKIIKAFYSVGLNESKISKYDEDIELKYVQKIDIVEKVIDTPLDEKIIEEDEKWIRIVKGKNYWLRIQYSIAYEDPITNFKITECVYDSSSKSLLLSKTYINEGYKPLEFSNLENSSFLLNDKYILLESEDITPYDNVSYKIPNHCNIKDKLEIPFKSQTAAIVVTRNVLHLPLKNIQIKRTQTSYQFCLIKHKSPISYTYLPEIINVYPLDTPSNPGIAMFCFPEGIKIKTTYNKPKWFSFILTDETGFRTYGTVLIFTEDLTKEIIQSFIPIYKTDNAFYIEKAICILSNYPFFYNCKIILKELYRISVSNESLIPLERVICHFVDSLYFQTIDKMLSLKIGNEDLKFYLVPLYGREWDINDESLEVLFSLLSFDTILTIWEALLLEKKVFMLCSSKSILLHISMALISLLFPFQWMNILVPILPEKLKVFLESPVPLLVGINFQINIKDFPEDAFILNIDKNAFEKYECKLPKLPSKLYNSLIKKANKIRAKYHLNNKQDEILKRIKCFDDVFPDLDLNYKNRIDGNEIRDIFYEFFIGLFKNYESYFNWAKKEKDEPFKIIKSVFLKDHSSNDPDSFLSLFCDTSLFSQFEDSFNYMQSSNATSFFINSIKNGKGKAKTYLQRKIPIISSVVPNMKTDDLNNRIYAYKTFPLLDNSLYIRTEVPKALYKTRFMYMLDEWCYDLMKLSQKDFARYILYSIYEIWFTLFSFIIHFYDDKKACVLMEHAMFLIEDLIHNQNITPSKNLLTKIIKSCGRSCLTSFANPLLQLVNSSNHKFSALFHNAFMNGLYALTENLEFNNEKSNSLLKNSLLNSVKANGSIRLSCIKLLNLDNIQTILERMIFLLYDLCPNCLNNTSSIRKISIEELLSGFSRGKSDFASICPLCFNKIFPKLYLFDEEQSSFEVDSVNFLSPIVLMKEVDNLIKNNGEKYFYHEDFHKDKYHRNIFWNLAFYFQLFDLPLFVMFLQNEDSKFSTITSSLKDARSRSKAVNTTSTQPTQLMTNKIIDINNNSNNTQKSIWEIKNGILSNIKIKIQKGTNVLKESDKLVNRNELNLFLCEIKQMTSNRIEHFIQNQQDKLNQALLHISKEINNSDNIQTKKHKNDTDNLSLSVETKSNKINAQNTKKKTDPLNLINLKEKFFSLSPKKGKTTLKIKINLNNK